MVTRSWLDRWLAEALVQNNASAPPPDSAISRLALLQYQGRQCRRTVDNARKNSPFYRTALRHVRFAEHEFPQSLTALPLTSAHDLREHPHAFLAASQDEVARVVSIPSSGTSGPGKRIFFTPNDLERIRHFFRRGMRNLVQPGETALVLLPGERPDSVGRLLGDALSSFDVRALVCGPLESPLGTLHRMTRENVRCVVGSPAHVHILAAHARYGEDSPKPRLRSALLCWDAVPPALAHAVEQGLHCRAFHHWGMVETGLGGAVECGRAPGMHLREADLYVEILCPGTGRLVPDGEWGEIVVTTLTRRAMPLIRYRTGDRGRILPGTCPCGSILRRLDPAVRRLPQDTTHNSNQNGSPLDAAALGDILYAVPGLADFAVQAPSPHQQPANVTIQVSTVAHAGSSAEDAVLQQVRQAIQQLSSLPCDPADVCITATGHGAPVLPGLQKRVLNMPTPPLQETSS
ncbi:Phenylacetate-coenzyme A ligase PaaK, adenylate-forming domain family [Paucidesulfovibrio gracilis DSM 16080]|uniref:Phenylacetate-coenzyme A ligase PaaK, adenylate-forming domain family n=1 Tax=Paucidesulfovibrio gracilis DSM 16080 TaxID=1121449 RepID=A0A1T4X5C6_9BACT|nr:AMP-binding protein [Paucidesulfovibrio gracilis]SKA84782.1 Phenylacetate-coenzyme A ligase PaaK, adenylate-forming domain family [Paucidesulfovibrio gracilis DSM 16080]